MPRKTSSELVGIANAEVQAAAASLAEDDTKSAVVHARLAYKTARAQRSFSLMSRTWLFLLDTLAADPNLSESFEYQEYVEGAFYWAETMPEEIQIWLFPAIQPHLSRVGLTSLVHRASSRTFEAQEWLELGNRNLRTRIDEFQLADLEAGRPIDAEARKLEREGAFYFDESFDPSGEILKAAATLWRGAGRSDRAEFLEQLVADRQP
ncbi:MAG: hypothetical protein WCF25_09990 [Acidimicrobiales bacterium]